MSQENNDNNESCVNQFGGSNISAMHNIDLEFLISPEQQRKFNEKYQSGDIDNIDNNELKFYRKRLLQLTRDLIAGEIKNTNLESAFKSYINESIKYLKFIDKKDIIQQEYSDLNNEIKLKQDKRKSKIKKNNMNNNSPNTNVTEISANDLLINRSQVKTQKIQDFEKIKRNLTDTNNEVLPKQRDINLKDPKLKKKGIKKKEPKDGNKKKSKNGIKDGIKDRV